YGRRRQQYRLPERQVRQVGARLLLVLFQQDAVGGPLQELEDVLRNGVRRSVGLRYRSAAVRLDPGCQHQTRSLRDYGWPTTEDADGHGRSDCFTFHRLSV